jgi:endonuclease YncB( thermonuclease family)
MTNQPHRRPRLRLLAAAITAAAGLVAPLLVSTAGPAAAGAVQYGKVAFIADGDTIDVDIAGDGTSRPVRIRYIGIQAMELRVYSHTLSKLRGECWGVTAAKNLHRILIGKRVQLTARHADSYSSKNRRLQRYVAVQVNGVWTDTGAMQLDAGLVLPDLLPDEYGKNLDYARRAQTAAANGIGFWGAPTLCGVGPSQDDPLEVNVNWDAEGNDSANVNGEWVDIINHGVNVVSLAGWWVRDAAYRGDHAHGYVFPAGAQVLPGEKVRLKIGHGDNDATTFFWGLDQPIFANVTGGAKWLGDGAWMFDPQGDLRAWNMYPCRAAC